MEMLAQLVNPWELSAPMWVSAVLGKELLLQGMDLSVSLMGKFMDLLPSRKGDKPLPQRALDGKDFFFLSLNSVIEMVFTSHLMFYLWHSDVVDRNWTALSLLNGPVALWLLVIVNDMFYAPLHRALHLPILYKWIHKHHHRVIYPQRGNIDARNEHPVEQLLAMSFWYLAVRIVTACVGMHAVAIVSHIAVMTVFACFNHTGFDLRFSVMGLHFSVQAHEMHHRRPDKNFGQLVMWWDQLMGTYMPYSKED